jgi:hypothetical protein
LDAFRLPLDPVPAFRSLALTPAFAVSIVASRRGRRGFLGRLWLDRCTS